jgi:hypothetical protein
MHIIKLDGRTRSVSEKYTVKVEVVGALKNSLLNF